MPSSGILCHVALVRTDISEEHITSIISVTRIGELGPLAATSNRSVLQRNALTCDSISSQRALVASYCSSFLVTLMMEMICSSKTFVLTRATQHNIPEDDILLFISLLQ
jgi:hypothetical protein